MTVASNSNTENGQRLGSLPLFLSLFLLLLAFFIFLNSISSFESGKSDRVIASIRASFPGFGDGGEGPGLLDADRAGRLEPSVSTRLVEAFTFAFPNLPLNVIDETDRIRVDVPLDSLFVAGSAEPRVTLRVLTRRLARVLGDPATTQQLETRLLFGYGDRTDAIAEDRTTLRRATEAIDAMIAAGAPKRATSVGLEPGHAEHLRFAFRVLASPAVAASPGSGS